MNYEVYINGKTTGNAIVNSPSENDAKKVWSRFHADNEITLKPIELNVPSMFQNCIMNISNFK